MACNFNCNIYFKKLHLMMFLQSGCVESLGLYFCELQQTFYKWKWCCRVGVSHVTAPSFWRAEILCTSFSIKINFVIDCCSSVKHRWQKAVSFLQRLVNCWIIYPFQSSSVPLALIQDEHVCMCCSLRALYHFAEAWLWKIWTQWRVNVLYKFRN